MKEARSIYAMRHNTTGRVYVGSTCHTPNFRAQQHISRLRSGRHPVELMQDDFNKYGENYTFYVLEICKPRDRYKETEWMLKLLSKDKRFGYNYKDLRGNGLEVNSAAPISLEGFEVAVEFHKNPEVS